MNKTNFTVPRFLSYYESDPLSPPEGEAFQGVHPLDPLYYFSRFLRKFSDQLSEGVRAFYKNAHE